MQIDILTTSTLSKSRCPFHRQKEGSFCLADCPHVRRAVYSTSQCAPDEFLRNSSIWCFRLELIEVITNITDFIRVLSRSSWFVFGAQEVMFRAKQNEPSAGGWDSHTSVRAQISPSNHSDPAGVSPISVEL